MASDLDVLIIGGYGISEMGGEDIKRRLRMECNGHPVTVDFIGHLVAGGGELKEAEMRFWASNPARQVTSPLGAIYLMDYLGKSGLGVEVVGYFAFEQERFRDLMGLRPRVVAISTTFIHSAAEIGVIARAVKESSPESLIVAGGAKVLKDFREHVLHARGHFDGCDTTEIAGNNFFFPQGRDQNIDVFVIEDCGEATLLDLVQRARNGEGYTSAPNIAYYDQDDVVFTRRVPEPHGFDSNIISWERVPDRMLGQEIPVRGGLGCPHRCAFCDFIGLHSRVEERSVESLIAELRAVNEAQPHKPVFFTDDNLFPNRRRVVRICEAIIAGGLQFRWRAFFRPDVVDEGNAELLAGAGCDGALLGVESGDEGILRGMGKRTTPEQVRRAVGLLNRAGISTLSSLIIGFPGETHESVERTIGLLNAYPDLPGAVNSYMTFVFNSLPLAPVNSPDARARHGLSGWHENWRHRTMHARAAVLELERCFVGVDGPTLHYPEAWHRSLPAGVARCLFRAREEFVKRGVRVVDETNVQDEFLVFRDILAAGS